MSREVRALNPDTRELLVIIAGLVALTLTIVTVLTTIAIVVERNRCEGNGGTYTISRTLNSTCHYGRINQ